jgi:exodeoxyribonuclease VII small subunit
MIPKQRNGEALEDSGAGTRPGVNIGAVTEEARASSSPPKEEARYEEIVQRLTKVVERLEGGGLSLEESIAAFEEGIQLARAGAQKLEEAERKVEQLLDDGRTVPFRGEEEKRR